MCEAKEDKVSARNVGINVIILNMCFMRRKKIAYLYYLTVNETNFSAAMFRIRFCQHR